MLVFSRKAFVFLGILAVSAVSVALATLSLTNKLLMNVAVVETDENAADKVTIYGNGFTFINYDETIMLESDTRAIQFYLPYGALTDTLTVSGINATKITTSQESHPIIETGDIITIYTEDYVYTGRFLGWDRMLLLEANNGTVMIPTERITKIILTEVVQTQDPKILVEVTTDSPPGEYDLKISYLMRGPRWKPTYFIDIESASLKSWATIENVENWKNFTLVLVSGGPHVVYRSPIFEPFFMPPIKAFIDFTSTTADEYHEYAYGTKLSFEKGTMVKLPLFSGNVGLRQEYYWSQGDVQNRYHMNNTLSEPLAEGLVEFYRGEKWVGEDAIRYTPVKGESVAVVNYAYDIKVTSTVTKSIEEYRHKVRGVNITINNYKPVGIQILIQQDINGYTLITSVPNATKVGATLSWITNVDAYGTASIYYEWEYWW